MSAIVSVGNTIPHVFLVESVVHAVRLIIEMYTSVTEPHPRLDVVAFETFAALTCVQIGQLFDQQVWCALPLLAVAIQCVVAGVYEYVAVALVVFFVATQCSIPVEWVVVAFTYLSLFVRSDRSNVLRVVSLTALFLAAFGGTLAWRRYIAVVALELASWATERYMMPWKIRGAAQCCSYGFRFFVGFIIGVHLLDGRAEPDLRLRPNQRGRSIAGVSVYGDRAYIRYRATPMGVLLAYVEGLHIVPLRIVRLSTVQPDVPSDEDTFRIILVGSVHLYDVDITSWRKVRKSDENEVALATCARYPFRRVLLGVLMRIFLG